MKSNGKSLGKTTGAISKYLNDMIHITDKLHTSENHRKTAKSLQTVSQDSQRSPPRPISPPKLDSNYTLSSDRLIPGLIVSADVIKLQKVSESHELQIDKIRRARITKKVLYS